MQNQGAVAKLFRVLQQLFGYLLHGCLAAVAGGGFFSIHSEKLNFLLEKSIIYVILLIMFK